MSLHDLVFEVVPGGQIFDPLSIPSDTLITIKLTNFGEEELTGLGVFIQPSTNVGSFGKPPAFPPETDYQDILAFGSKTHMDVASAGGLKLYLPQNNEMILEALVHRASGSMRANKIPLADLPPEGSLTFQVELVAPAAAIGRRFYINLVVE